MTSDENEDWRFRAAVFTLTQKKDANGRAKARQVLSSILRSDYRVTRADQLALAEYFDDRKAGRPKRNPFTPISRAVARIRSDQERHGYKRAQAIELYKWHLQLTMGAKDGAAHFKKYENEILEELRRAKKR